MILILDPSHQYASDRMVIVIVISQDVYLKFLIILIEPVVFGLSRYAPVRALTSIHSLILVFRLYHQPRSNLLLCSVDSSPLHLLFNFLYVFLTLSFLCIIYCFLDMVSTIIRSDVSSLSNDIIVFNIKIKICQDLIDRSKIKKK